MQALPQYYLKSAEEVLKEFSTTKKNGLGKSEVQKRLQEKGYNEITFKEHFARTKKFLKQFKDVFVLLLSVAAVIAYALGDTRSATILLLIVVINAIISFIQEYKADKLISSLNSMLTPMTKVVREGAIEAIPSRELVPGDIVVLEEGDSVPADIRVIEANRLQVNGFALTGESNPQHKNDQPLSGFLAYADQTNMVFMGSTIATGSGKGVVVGTGFNTFFGSIAYLSHTTDHPPTPLQKQSLDIAKKNTIVALLIAVIIVILGVTVLQMSLNEAMIFAVGVASAMVPQGLPAEINVALALSSMRLAKQKVITRQLTAVEGLGAVNVICTDKTGTITKNEMTVEWMWFPGKEISVTGSGYIPEGKFYEGAREWTNEDIQQKKLFFLSAFFNSHARLKYPDEHHPVHYIIGDPTEGALRVLGRKAGFTRDAFEKESIKVDELGFDSTRKRMSSIYFWQKSYYTFTKGAPEETLLGCTHYVTEEGKVEVLGEEMRREILKKNIQYAEKAYRVLAIAYKQEEEKHPVYTVENTESGLIFLGLVAMVDPPREGVAEAFAAAHKAHIKTMIITGDHAVTAEAIAKKIHLIEEGSGKKIKTIHGKDLHLMNDEQLKKDIKEYDSLIFARVTPEQKLRIVNDVKALKLVVAVTGDGVNDAPALKTADIGVAMGITGTDVAKEASQMVLADDSYGTLVSAIKEGRTIFANLKKIILSCYTSNYGELFAILTGVVLVAFFGLPSAYLPLITTHLLLIDLVGELLPLMALTFDPSTPGIMERKPRGSDAKILTFKSTLDICFTGLLEAACGIALFLYVMQGDYHGGAELDRARTMVYLGILLAQFINILSRRLGNESLWNAYFFSSPKLFVSFTLSMTAVASFIFFPPFANFLGFGIPQVGDIGVLLVVLMLFTLIVEGKKKVMRRGEIKREAPVLVG